MKKNYLKKKKKKTLTNTAANLLTQVTTDCLL